MNPDTSALRIKNTRLGQRLHVLAQIGNDADGICRLALSAEDDAGRDLVLRWMRELDLLIRIDAIGNVVGVRPGAEDIQPVMTGLEVIKTLNDAGLQTRQPLAVAFFTNEEVARFNPDKIGSLVYVGGMTLDAALPTVGIDGATVGECIERIGYAGPAPCGQPKVQAYVELHVEQGQVLEAEGMHISSVESVQGISWTVFTVLSIANHADATPMRLRRDAGYVVCAVANQARHIAREMGANQVAIVGAIELSPNLANVTAYKVVLTVDLRNTDEATLQLAEQRLHHYAREVASAEGVTLSSRQLARFEPVDFDPTSIALVEATAQGLELRVKRMPSGAGHDAQMLTRVCPTAMSFVPSTGYQPQLQGIHQPGRPRSRCQRAATRPAEPGIVKAAHFSTPHA